MYGWRRVAVGLAIREIDPQAQRLSECCRECGILCGWFIPDCCLTGWNHALLRQLELRWADVRFQLSRRGERLGSIARWRLSRHGQQYRRCVCLENCLSSLMG